MNPTITYQNMEACKEHPCPAGPPFFSYRLIGKTPSDIYVLLTQDSGGGSGIFTTLLLVILKSDTGLAYDEKNHTLRMSRKRTIIKRLEQIPLGDRYKGVVSLSGNTLHISRNQSRIKTGAFEKDTDISIKGFH